MSETADSQKRVQGSDGDTADRTDRRGPRRPLGATGLSVSTLGFGTVELGMDYGIPRDGALPTAPTEDEGVALLHAAFAAGVDFVDTAPGYGRAESVVGAALASWSGPPPTVATKVPCPATAALADEVALAGALRASVETSCDRLGRSHLDLVQVHNATAEAIAAPAFAAALRSLVTGGLARHLGASTYGAEAGRAAIDARWCETIQLAYNLLDQEAGSALIGAAKGAGMGVIVRSALLKGVLAAGGADLPPALRPLAPRLERAAAVAAEQNETLTALALRFVLSDPRVDSVLVGIDRSAFLEEDLALWRLPPLAAGTLMALRALNDGSSLTDPRTWGF